MQEPEDIYRKIRNYIRKNRMIGPGDVVVAGISGGGDSVAMLSMLCRLREEIFFSLFAVHVHHGIRGAEADRDQAFVEELCRKWGVPCTVYAYDVPKLAKKWGMGHEEAGRLARQEAFSRELLRREAEIRETGEQEMKAQETEQRRIRPAFRVALAHNQDDAAETLLFNLCRGCGLKGFSAMRPVSGKIIRPVLCLEKTEIGDYLKGKTLSFMTDSTNSQEDYTRNRIRKNILPLLREQVNSEAVRHIAGTAQILAQAEDFLSCQSAALVESTVRWEYQDGVFLDLPSAEDWRDVQEGLVGKEQEEPAKGSKKPGKARLSGCFLPDAYFAAEPALVSEGLLEIFCRISGRRKDFTQAHVSAVRALLEKRAGQRSSLPYRLLAERTYGGIRIFRPENVPEKVPGTLKTKIFPFKGQKIEEKKYTKWLDCDKIKSGLALRGRREGDFLVISAAGDKKKLNRYFIDAKVPRALRDRIPLVAQGSEILWVVGYRISEKYKITPGTKNILELCYETEECSAAESGGSWVSHTKEEAQDERKNQSFDQ